MARQRCLICILALMRRQQDPAILGMKVLRFSTALRGLVHEAWLHNPPQPGVCHAMRRAESHPKPSHPCHAHKADDSHLPDLVMMQGLCS